MGWPNLHGYFLIPPFLFNTRSPCWIPVLIGMGVARIFPEVRTNFRIFSLYEMMNDVSFKTLAPFFF